MRAQFVYVEDDTLIVAFPAKTAETDLMMFAALIEVDGSETSIGKAAGENGADEAAHGVIAVQTNEKTYEAVAKRIRLILRPVLSATASSVTLTLNACACGHVTIAGSLKFVPCFAPDDLVAVRSYLMTRLENIDLDSYQNQDDSSPLMAFLKASREILRDVGVYTQSITAVVEQNTSHCTQ